MSIFLALFLLQDSYSQTGVSLSFGPSIPLGKYSTKNSKEIHDGFVKGGFSGDFSIISQFIPQLGMIFSYSGFGNDIDFEAMTELVGGDTSRYSNGGSRWVNGGFYFGLISTIALDKWKNIRLSGDIRYGIQFHSRPQIFITSDDYSTSYRIGGWDESSPSWIFRLQIGYYLDVFSISVGPQLVTSNPTIIVSNFSGGGEAHSYHTVPVNTLIYQVSIRFRFGKENYSEDPYQKLDKEPLRN